MVGLQLFLYKSKTSPTWRSRYAYSTTLYNTQMCSKKDYHDVRYWNIKEELDKLYLKFGKSHYRSVNTKLLNRMERLEKELELHDKQRTFSFDF